MSQPYHQSFSQYVRPTSSDPSAPAQDFDRPANGDKNPETQPTPEPESSQFEQDSKDSRDLLSPSPAPKPVSPGQDTRDLPSPSPTSESISPNSKHDQPNSKATHDNIEPVNRPVEPFNSADHTVENREYCEYVLANPMENSKVYLPVLARSLVYWVRPTLTLQVLVGSVTVLFVISHYNLLHLASGFFVLAILARLLFVNVARMYAMLFGDGHAHLARRPHSTTSPADGTEANEYTFVAFISSMYVEFWAGVMVDAMNIAFSELAKIVLIEDTHRSLEWLFWSSVVWWTSAFIPAVWMIGTLIVSILTLPQYYAKNKEVLNERATKTIKLTIDTAEQAKAKGRFWASYLYDWGVATGKMVSNLGGSLKKASFKTKKNE